jgi:predicted RNA-binding protein associated with RNAse of E/G family
MAEIGLTNVVVIKLNPERQETWRYSGRVLEQSEEVILVEAFFNREDIQFHGILMRKGDRFLEKYFLHRWYNIYEIHDRDDNRIKGWYCNISEPAEVVDNHISYVDLALDLLVYPNGTQLVLDEDEFTALQISGAARKIAVAALEELKVQFSNTALQKFE